MTVIEHEAAYNNAIKRNILMNAQKTFERTYPDHADIYAFIGTGRVYGDRGVEGYKDGFVGSLAKSFDSFGKLTEGQVNAVRKCIEQRKQRQAEWADQKAALNASRQHIGTVGDKVTMTLTTVHVIMMDSMYGTNLFHICEDADKNIVIYKGKVSGFPYKGETATVVATIKEHGVRDGVKQTVIQRPKVVDSTI